jgi:hypothetical protein
VRYKPTGKGKMDVFLERDEKTCAWIKADGTGFVSLRIHLIEEEDYDEDDDNDEKLMEQAL